MLLNSSKILMKQIFHSQFSLYDAIFAAKKVSYKNLCKACHKLFKWVKQHLMITNSFRLHIQLIYFKKNW